MTARRACCAGTALIVLLLGAGLLAGALAVRRSGLSARPDPGPTEARLARMVRGFAMDPEERLRSNPVPPTPRVLAEARAHYADHCASCHANDGSGATALGRRLYPRAPDMRLPATQELSDGELFFIIENGVRLTGMPGWGGGPPEASWGLVHFIRHLPRLGPEEILEMEKLNPRSPAEWRELQEDEQFLQGDDPTPAPRSGHEHHGKGKEVSP
ncbi:MAG: c-type cytochrome [Deltaproteobacteria bacterium]|nr:c-type cytochrome [Deltaproteobacteria bacterium]